VAIIIVLLPPTLAGVGTGGGVGVGNTGLNAKTFFDACSKLIFSGFRQSEDIGS
jgi:hypothetical protein